MGETRKITKFYNALIKAIILQCKIEKLIMKYNLVAIYDASIREEINRLSVKLDYVTCLINDYKKKLAA